MTQEPKYFALGYGLPGCLPNSLMPYAVTTRRELVDALRSEVKWSGLPQRVFREMGVRNLWGHAKRHGFSIISREIPTGNGGECFLFMGLTEQEYNDAVASEE